MAQTTSGLALQLLIAAAEYGSVYRLTGSFVIVITSPVSEQALEKIAIELARNVSAEGGSGPQLVYGRGMFPDAGTTPESILVAAGTETRTATEPRTRDSWHEWPWNSLWHYKPQSSHDQQCG